MLAAKQTLPGRCPGRLGASGAGDRAFRSAAGADSVKYSSRRRRFHRQHDRVACVDAGISPVILDNLGTGRREFTTGRAFYQGDIADGALIDRIFADHPGISAAIQCAALIVSRIRSLIRRLLPGERGQEPGVRRASAAQRMRADDLQLVGRDLRPGADLTVDEDSRWTRRAHTRGPRRYARRCSLISPPRRPSGCCRCGTSTRSARIPNSVPAAVAAATHALGKIIQAYEEGIRSRSPAPTTDPGRHRHPGLHPRLDLATAHLAALDRFDALMAGWPPPPASSTWAPGRDNRA